ncbi:MAG: SPOR domain-containing protein [Pseudomonadota bacterium]
MPPDLPNNQELALKKRARRRLVGAIALVVLMVVFLPMILQDRAALAPQEAIKITMPASTQGNNQQPAVEDMQAPEVKSKVGEPSKPVADINPEASTDITAEKSNIVAKEEKNTQPKTQDKVNAETKVKAKAAEVKVAAEKTTEAKTADTQAQPKTPNSFAVQIGVYSEMTNVKQLQEKLKQAGYKSHIETLNTPKGEKFRIRVSSFHSRQDAASALEKIQAAGLPGMVISNE